MHAVPPCGLTHGSMAAGSCPRPDVLSLCTLDDVDGSSPPINFSLCVWFDSPTTIVVRRALVPLQRNFDPRIRATSTAPRLKCPQITRSGRVTPRAQAGQINRGDRPRTRVPEPRRLPIPERRICASSGSAGRRVLSVLEVVLAYWSLMRVGDRLGAAGTATSELAMGENRGVLCE